jgi:hypothetical protein
VLGHLVQGLTLEELDRRIPAATRFEYSWDVEERVLARKQVRGAVATPPPYPTRSHLGCCRPAGCRALAYHQAL